MKKLNKVSDFNLIEFEEEIEVNENKLELYFYNAYDLFQSLDCKEGFYFDGYLTLDLENRTAKIMVVQINDSDDRKYYKYIPNKEETTNLFNAAEKYCLDYYKQNLEEYHKETISEENEENEQ